MSDTANLPDITNPDLGQYVDPACTMALEDGLATQAKIAIGVKEVPSSIARGINAHATKEG